MGLALIKRLVDGGRGGGGGGRCSHGETSMEAIAGAEAKWLGRGRTAKRIPSALERPKVSGADLEAKGIRKNEGIR